MVDFRNPATRNMAIGVGILLIILFGVVAFVLVSRHSSNSGGGGGGEGGGKNIKFTNCENSTAVFNFITVGPCLAGDDELCQIPQQATKLEFKSNFTAARGFTQAFVSLLWMKTQKTANACAIGVKCPSKEKQLQQLDWQALDKPANLPVGQGNMRLVVHDQSKINATSILMCVDFPAKVIASSN